MANFVPKTNKTGGLGTSTKIWNQVHHVTASFGSVSLLEESSKLIVKNGPLEAQAINITSHDGATDGLSLGGTLVTATATQISNIAGSAVLEDLNTLGAPASDGQFIVATGAGAFAYEAGSTARDSIGLGTGDSPTFTSLTLSGQANSLAMNNQKITGLSNPSADGDAATKAYVDGVAQGLDVKQSVQIATTSNININVMLSTGGTLRAIDGQVVATGDRVLVKDQTNASENGIYIAGVGHQSVRADDLAASSSAAGAFVFVEKGTVNADLGFVCTTDKGSDVVGTNNLTFTQFSGAGSITAGTGLAKSGNTLSLDSTSSPTFASLTLSGQASALAMNSQKITGLATPTTTTDAATKAYVDNLVQGLDVKQSVQLATTGNININLMLNTNVLRSLDGQLVAAGDRVLVKDQTTASENGIYIAGAGFNSVRADDLAASSSAAGAFVFVEKGTANADLGFVCTSDKGSDVVGTNNLTFTQFTSIGGGINSLSADTSPQLGGSLDVNGQDIVSVSNGNITLTPNGSGVVRIDGTSGIDLQSGEIAVKNAGSVSNIKLYCEVGNAHYTQLQSAAHGSYSGNVTLTLPTSTGNLVGSGDTGTVTNTMLAGSITASKLNNAIFADLETLGAPSSDGQFIVATGTGAFAYESGATARTSLGLGTGDSPTFTSLTLTSQSGSLAMNSQKITGLATPVADADAATKSYVDSVAQGLSAKDSVRAATTANGTLASAFANGQAIDGITLATGDRILIKDQTSGDENGIYTVNASGAPTRAVDFDANAEVAKGAFIFVEEGTTNADSGFVLTTDGSITLDTTALSFTQFSGAGQITAGSALTKSGNTLNVAVDDSSIEINADALRVKASGITSAMLAGSIANSKLNQLTTANKVALTALDLDGGTDIGADLVDADLIVVDDGAGGTNRKSALSRIKKYIFSSVSGDATATDSGAFTVSGGANFSSIGSNVLPSAADTYSLGSATAEWSDLYLGDSSKIYFGNDQDIYFEHGAQNQLSVKMTNQGINNPVFELYSSYNYQPFNNVGPIFRLTSAPTLAYPYTSPKVNDVIGNFVFRGQDNGGAVADYGKIRVVTTGVTNNSESSKLELITLNAGSSQTYTFGNSSVTIPGDIILNDGGSIKEAGGTAAITIDASGEVTKIGQDSPSDGQFLQWDGSNGKVVWAASSGGSDLTSISSNVLPSAADTYSLGSATAEWSDLYLGDSSRIYFGNDQDVFLEHDPDDGLVLDMGAGVTELPYDPSFKIVSQGGGTTIGPSIQLFLDKANPNSSTRLGQIIFAGQDSVGNTHWYGHIGCKPSTNTNGSETGSIFLSPAPASGNNSLPGLTIDGVTGDNTKAIVKVTNHNGSDSGLKLGGTLVTSVASELNALDVSAQSPSDNEVLTYTAASGLHWAAAGGGGGASVPNVTSASPGSAYTISTSSGIEEVYLLTPSTAISVNLPAASSAGAGYKYNIKNLSTNTITLDPNSSETIDGSATFAISSQYSSVTIVSDGSNWFII